MPAPAPVEYPGDILRDMAASGLSDPHIAALFGCHSSSIWRRRKELGIPACTFKAQRIRVAPDLHAERLYSLRSMGVRIDDIAAIHRVSVATIKQRLAKFGISKKRAPSVKVRIAREEAIHPFRPIAATGTAANPFGL